MKSDASSSTSQAKITEDLLFQHTNLKKLIQDELFSMVKRKSIDQTSDDILLEVKLDDILFESERCEKDNWTKMNTFIIDFFTMHITRARFLK